LFSCIGHNNHTPFGACQSFKVAVLFAFTVQGLDTSRWPLGKKK